MTHLLPSVPGASRRRVITGVLGAGFVAGLTPPLRAFTPGRGAVSESAGQTPERVLVTITLRGGFDGLLAVAPRTGEALLAGRPHLWFPGAQSLQLDDTFGLHPAMSALMPHYTAGRLAVVHAVGNGATDRSLAQAGQRLRTGAETGSDVTSGWLARALGPGGSPLRSVSFAERIPVNSPGAGASGHVSLTSLDQIDTGYLSDEALALYAKYLPRMFDAESGALRASMDTTMKTLLQAREHHLSEPPAMPGFPGSPLGRQLRSAVATITSGVGARTIAVEQPGWDLHVGAGTGTSGSSVSRLADLALCLNAFWAALGDRADSVTVLTLTEFGRSVAENGLGGTEHGEGTAMFVMGAGVRGGKVYGDWPGLDDKDLSNGALRMTTDWRQVAAEVLAQGWGTEVREVFEDLDYRPVGLTS